MEKRDCYKMVKPCDACPWRKDVPTGNFLPERYEQLRHTAEQGFHPVFACHKTIEGKEQVCAGYLIVVGAENFYVRLAIITGRLDLTKLSSPYPMYKDYEEMAEANGVPK